VVLTLEPSDVMSRSL